MNQDIKEILITQEEIQATIKRMAEEINRDYEGKELVLICMLKGGAPFMMDLIKYITIPVQIDFMQVSSYHGQRSSNVVFKKDIELDIIDKHIIVVDDIIDTGKTTMEVYRLFQNRHVASIEVACLLDKPSGRIVNYNPKYIGLTVPNAFVVGYGLDYNEFYRNLPYIGVLKDEIYQ